MSRLRPMQYHGKFYPADPAVLTQSLNVYLKPQRVGLPTEPIKVAIIPHAGYAYSGRIAGLVYAGLQTQKERIKRIVLLAPNHQFAHVGGLISTYEAFASPLGAIPLDHDFIKTHWLPLEQLSLNDAAHDMEYSIEVQLPFIRYTLPDATLAPLLLSSSSPETLRTLLQAAWEDNGTLILISSDLYHYLPPTQAVQRGMQLSRTILEHRYMQITPEDACGAIAINALSHFAHQNNSYWLNLATQHSQQTSAYPHDQVVGYGGFLLFMISNDHLSMK